MACVNDWVDARRMGTSTVHCVIVCEAMISCDILLFSGLKNRKAVMLCHAHLFRFSGFFSWIVWTFSTFSINELALTTLPHHKQHTHELNVSAREGVCKSNLLRCEEKKVRSNPNIVHMKWSFNQKSGSVGSYGISGCLSLYSQNSMKGKL